MNRTLLIALSTVVVILLTGCSPNAESPAGSAAADSKPMAQPAREAAKRQMEERDAAMPEPLAEAKPQPAPPPPASPALAPQRQAVSVERAKAAGEAGRVAQFSNFV
ncbi:MAG: hypothetical protein KDJ28_05015, partial [Candidatus Competibacteraceae bacterium]|nr:hypothetical protein [Candidatus Competibacteraceae bacterium]